MPSFSLAQLTLVLVATTGAALATGFGALPFAFTRRPSTRMVAYAHAIAAGLMLGASLGLGLEGVAHGGWQTAVGAILGGLVIVVTQRCLSDEEDLHFAGVSGAGARRMLLVVAIMTAHSAAEGVALGVAFGGVSSLGLAITLAIALHNVPEGLAVSAVLRPQGKSLWSCAGWSIFSSLPQPLLAVPAYLCVARFSAILPYGLGFAIGAMAYLAVVELMPEAYAEARPVPVSLVTLGSTLGMVLLQRVA